MLDESIPNAQLYFGDCLERMKNIADGSVDFFFTDLPYGTTQCRWDIPIPLDKFWEEVNRVTKVNGAIALFAQTPFDKVLGVSNLKNLRYEWIWEKTEATGFLNSRRMPMKAHENILVFYRKAPTYNPQKTTRHTPVHNNYKSADVQNKSAVYGKVNKDSAGGGATDRFPRSVLKGPTDKQRNHLHPTQKPIWLCETLIRTYTNPGEVVCDCCAGSGSIGAAALMNDRRYIGIEKDGHYFDVMRERLQKCSEGSPILSTDNQKGVY